MINHLSFGVSDLARATVFYDAVLGALGYSRTRSTTEDAAYGPGRDQTFFLYPTDGSVAGARMHLAFDAPSKEAVVAFHAEALKRGGRSVLEPGTRPDISADYFGAIIDDLDGHRIEVVVAPATMH